MSKLQSGAKILVEECMKITPKDRVVIISEYPRKDIAEAIENELKEKDIPYTLLFIEDYTSRPVTDLPQKMVEDIKSVDPTVSIYAATGKAGELPSFRGPLMKMLTKNLKCRHGHMIGIDKNIFEIGMNQDYEKIHTFTKKLTSILEKTSKVRATCPYGTRVEFTIDNSKYKWDPCTGYILEQGYFSNLPDGETFTYPSLVNGNIVAWVLGDSFGKEGVLDDPLIVEIKDSYIKSISSKNERLKKEFEEYVSKYEFGNRVGELGIGTLLDLKEFTGNLLLDEKFPGVHVAFGFPYGDLTGAEWSCESHVDIIPKEVTIEIFCDNQWVKIMESGRYLHDVIDLID